MIPWCVKLGWERQLCHVVIGVQPSFPLSVAFAPAETGHSLSFPDIQVPWPWPWPWFSNYARLLRGETKQGEGASQSSTTLGRLLGCYGGLLAIDYSCKQDRSRLVRCAPPLRHW